MTIHDPDVALTDLALAILSAYLGWRLWGRSEGGGLRRSGAVLLGALAGAALWGAIFHAFFPAGTATLMGSLAWKPVALSIVVATATMLDLGLGLLVPQLPLRFRRSVVLMYATGFAAAVLLWDDSFTRIVYFYVPTLVLLLLASLQQAMRHRSGGWALVLAGLLLSAGAATLQQARVALHPVYFDHNAVYHLVQSVAIVFLYLGWQRASDSPLAHRS
ncbi:MAG TPA: hypothetical protein VGC48_00395 [Gemmatimonadales bacterium]